MLVSARLLAVADSHENQFESKFGMGDNCENTFTTLPADTEQEAKIEETRRIEEEGSTPGEVKMGLQEDSALQDFDNRDCGKHPRIPRGDDGALGGPVANFPTNKTAHVRIQYAEKKKSTQSALPPPFFLHRAEHINDSQHAREEKKRRFSQKQTVNTYTCGGKRYIHTYMYICEYKHGFTHKYIQK